MNGSVMTWFCCLTSCVSIAQAGSVLSSDANGGWQRRQVETVKQATRVDAVNQYGGSERKMEKATGFFRVIKKSGRWWLVDPDGCLFIMKGVNSVDPKRVEASDTKVWAKDTYDLLIGSGFNTLGRWSEPEPFKETGLNIPWCGTLNFMGSYKRMRSSDNGESGYPNETLPVFDREWPEFCARYAEEQTEKFRQDPWLIGYFSDNELPFRPDALDKYLSLPESDSGHRAAVAWMQDNKVKESDLKDPEVKADFLEMVARRYFETVSTALKEADPDHLFLGSRLHGRCISEPVIRAAGTCDVISINYYHRWEPEEERMEEWEDWSGRPFFVSEFYAMKVADEDTKADGAGFRVLDHDDAAAFYHTHIGGLLEVSSCVGWHWFKYADDTPEWQKGIVGIDGTVHRELVYGMKIINEQAYALRGPP